MKFSFEVGKSYNVIGGLKLEVLVRSKKHLWAFFYCSDFKTPPFVKRIYICKNEEVLICNNVIICGAKYFSKGVKNEKYKNRKNEC